MQQITVPQFLDVEDKIIGPITVRQFIELLIGGMVIFIFYKIFDFSLFVVSGLFVLALSVIFAFAKINGQSFHNFLLNLITTLRSPKLKVWRKKVDIGEIKIFLKKKIEEPMKIPEATRQPITTSNLSELSLIVDTGGVYQGEGMLESETNVKK